VIFLTLFLVNLTLLKPPIYVKSKSINDFARLVCSLERIPLPVFEYMYKDENIFSVNLDSLNERPLIYYINYISSKENQYLSYKIHNNYEEVILVDSIRDTSSLYSLLIKIKNLPASFLKSSKISNTCRYICIGLKDIFSLSKIAAYRTLYDESPMPLFLFPKKDSNFDNNKSSYVIGTYLNATNTSEHTYFYYILLEHDIEKSFLKFSTQKANKLSYSNHIDEHGSIYLKIIKLDSPHPLVKL
jgi:hypothetical protein